jgi:hypothetical protein
MGRMASCGYVEKTLGEEQRVSDFFEDDGLDAREKEVASLLGCHMSREVHVRFEFLVIICTCHTGMYTISEPRCKHHARLRRAKINDSWVAGDVGDQGFL